MEAPSGPSDGQMATGVNLYRFFDGFWGPGASFRCHLRACGRPGHHLRLVGSTFEGTWTDFSGKHARKDRFCDFNTPLQRNHYFLRSGRPGWSHLVQKVAPRRRPGQPKWRSGRQKRRQVRELRSTCLKDVCDSEEIRPDSSRVGGQSLSNRQVI